MSSISDFFEWYPEISNPDFNSLLSRKVEFSELVPPNNQPPIKRGEKFNHQKYGIRYGTHYDRCAFIHDPGTGKSCIIEGLAELFKREYFKDRSDPIRISRAVILVRGPTLKENIRNEIVCKCTDGIYETPSVLNASSETVMKSNLTRELNEWYDILTYGEFATEFNKLVDEHDIEKYMSNKAIFVDEAHNIATIKDILTGDDIEEKTTLEEEEEEEKSNYKDIFRAFHSGKRNKIFLFTATPMINGSKEFPFLMNLILPEKEWPGQMPLWDDNEFEQLEFSRIEPYLRGRVSYIRALNTGAIEKCPEGSMKPENYQICIYPCEMSIFQYTRYKLARSLQEVSIEGKKQAFYGNQRQASNFVFPDGSWGKAGFSKYFEYKNGNYDFKDTADGQQFKNLIKDYRMLQEMSAKYAEIVRICQNAYPGVEVRDDQGIVYIYFPEYVYGSGAVLLGKVLEEYGYEQYKESTSVFVSQTGKRMGPCESYNVGSEQTRNSRIEPRRRYAILTYRTTRAQIVSMFDTLKSYENRYGHLIQVIIVSRVGQEGISIDNAIYGIMTSSAWNYARYYQARDRIFRTTSHNVLLEEKKRRLLARGESIENLKLDIYVYNMASVYTGFEDQGIVVINNENVDLKESDGDTIDVRMYLLSEMKNRNIRRIMRFIKMGAIDCLVNYKRNVRPEDINGAPVCDYMDCEYSCAGINKELLKYPDRSTKILYYLESEIKTITDKIRTLFSMYSSLKLDQIYKLIDSETIYIDITLEKIIQENIRFIDRMGSFGYLRDTPEGIIYLEKDPFVIKSSSENTTYTSLLIGTQDPRNDIFSDYVKSVEISNQQAELRELISMNTKEPRFAELLESLALVNKVYLLEHVLQIRQVQRQTNDFINAIISAFSNSIYELVEPITALQNTAYALANKGKGRGRKSNPNSKPKIKKVTAEIAQYELPEFNLNAPAEKVIIHTLLSQEFDRTSYNTVSKYYRAVTKLRILKVSENIGWRDTNEYEYPVYNGLIQSQIMKQASYFERFDIYGIMLPPEQEFRIRDKSKEDYQKVQANKKYEKSGKICITWDKDELVDILYRLTPQQQTHLDSENKMAIINNLLRYKVKEPERFTDDKLLFFNHFYQPSNYFNKENLCEIIKSYFIQTGRMFTGRITAEMMSTIPVQSSGSLQVGPSVPPTYGGLNLADTETTIVEEEEDLDSDADE